MKRKVLFLAFAAIISFFMVNARAQSIHSYLQNHRSAIEYIGKLAHPAQSVQDVEYVKGTSSYIDVNIEFGSLLRSYWEPYRINLKQYDGFTYAYSIVRTRAVSIYEPFIALDWFVGFIGSVSSAMGHSASDYDNEYRILYGTSESGLSKEQKAAIMLMNYIYGD